MVQKLLGHRRFEGIAAAGAITGLSAAICPRRMTKQNVVANRSSFGVYQLRCGRYRVPEDVVTANLAASWCAGDLPSRAYAAVIFRQIEPN